MQERIGGSFVPMKSAPGFTKGLQFCLTGIGVRPAILGVAFKLRLATSCMARSLGALVTGGLARTFVTILLLPETLLEVDLGWIVGP